MVSGCSPAGTGAASKTVTCKLQSQDTQASSQAICPENLFYLIFNFMATGLPPTKQLEGLIHELIWPSIEPYDFEFKKSSFSYNRKLNDEIVQRFSMNILRKTGRCVFSSYIGIVCRSVNSICVDAGIPGSTKAGNTYSYGIKNLFKIGGDHSVSDLAELPLAALGLVEDFKERALLCFSEINSLPTLEAALNAKDGRYFWDYDNPSFCMWSGLFLADRPR